MKKILLILLVFISLYGNAYADFVYMGSGANFHKKDQTTNAMVTVDEGLHKIYSGNSYFVKTWTDIDGAGTIVYFMFITPNTTTRIHAMAILDAEAEFTVEIYEGGTVSDNGTQIPGMNNDRDSSNTAELVAYSGPTVTDDGDLMWSSKVGSEKNSTGVAPGLNYEIIAKTNEIYLFKITKEASGTHWLDVDFFWYEHSIN